MSRHRNAIDFKTWCEQNDRIELLLEWDSEKNGTMSPSCISYGCHHNIWWKCSNGHEWQETPNKRTSRKSMCPFCSGHRVLSGFNDLQTKYPLIAKEWHPTKNGILKPTDVTSFSQRNVWWFGKCGHEWEAKISNRVSGNTGCPYCANKKVLTGFNDLQTRYPNIAEQWNIEKNGGLLPSEVMPGFSEKVWWICSNGHEWLTSPNSRTNSNRGCPYCANKRVLHGMNDLMSTYPQIAKEWHPTKNGDLKPTDFVFGSHKKVWWQCSKAHEWKADIVSRTTGGHKCPYCSGNLVIKKENDLETLRPDIAKEWHPTKNGETKPSDVKGCSNKKVWWRCVKGHEWQATINNRTSHNQGCPFCSGIGTSLPEQGIAFYLEQVCNVEQRKKLCGKEVDVFLPEYNIGIEYDGLFFHPESSSAKEKEKDRILSENGVKVIRIKESDVNALDGCRISYIVDKLNSNYEWAIKQLCNILYKESDEERFKTIDVDIQRDLLSIRARLSLYCKENSLATKYPVLSREWNFDKNGELTPELVSFGSVIKVWWKCSNGHEWQAFVNSRTNTGSGCPYCSNKKVIPGQTDLMSLYPEIAKEWHPTKNGKMKPSDILSKSNSKVWWLCSNGHEWKAAIDNRTGINRTGCPYCGNKKVLPGFNDFKTKFPDISKEWNSDRNKSLRPEDVLYGSHRKVWWQCSKGHEWSMSLVDRSNGRGCPKCSKKKGMATRRSNLLANNKSFSSVHPELVDEWNEERNAPLLPTQVTFGSQDRVWWRCAKGHEWEATVASRSSGRGCPFCADKLPKKVKCIETNVVYTSIADATRSTNIHHIGSCCNKKQKTAGGYHWEYVDQ